MISCLPTTFLLVACILACAALSGAYGVAISAVGSAVLTSLSLVQAFKQRVDVNFNDPLQAMNFSVDDPIVLAGVLLGAIMPMLFAALTMISVGKAAAEIIIE